MERKRMTLFAFLTTISAAGSLIGTLPFVDEKKNQESTMNILVTGGAGYIGSHVCKALSEHGFVPVVLDNLSNGHEWAVKWGPFVKGDILDNTVLDAVFTQYKPIGVIHLASFIDVREAEENPQKYHRNNVEGTRHLLEAMVRHGVDQLVFSSTAAVYGHPEKTPLTEDMAGDPINAYGKTKWLAEQLISDYQIRSVCLRYFNAAGADAAAGIGEAHTPETHLIPVAIAAALEQKPVKIFGSDHPTADGTAIRDFIHVTDLANAHVLALKWLMDGGTKIAINLGTGKGYSVKEVIDTIEKLVGPLTREITHRNLCDPPILVADIALARAILGWMPQKSDLDTIISSALEWHNATSSFISFL
jgi:UDP-arabinose 4-epimerase